MTRIDYGYQKERQGWSVWTRCPHTGDKRDYIKHCRSSRDAQRAVNALYRQQAERLAFKRKEMAP